MASKLIALSFDAHNPRRVARFWSGLLGWEMVEEEDGGYALLPSDDTGFRLEFYPSEEQKRGQNQTHFDLTSNLEKQQEIVDRSLELGAKHIDVGQLPEEGHVVLATLRATSSASSRQATTSSLTAGSSERSRATARSRSGTSGARRWAGRWSGTRTRRPRSARRTAVRRSRGAARRLHPKLGKNRLHFDIAPPADGDQQAEVDRLVSLGAKKIDIGQGDVSWVVMADPDGNEFCVLVPR